MFVFLEEKFSNLQYAYLFMQRVKCSISSQHKREIKYHYNIMKENASLYIMIRGLKWCYFLVLLLSIYPGGSVEKSVRFVPSSRLQRPCKYLKSFCLLFLEQNGWKEALGVDDERAQP